MIKSENRVGGEKRTHRNMDKKHKLEAGIVQSSIDNDLNIAGNTSDLKGNCLDIV